MKVCFDFETRSPVPIKLGPVKYATEAEVLCMAYTVDDADPVLWLPGDEFPHELLDATTLQAWNAGFELAVWDRCCRRLYGWPELPSLMSVTDTQARALLAGLPRALGQCAVALGLPADQQKDTRGKALINKLCKPKKDGTYNEDPELLQELYDYCMQDVVTERAISRGLPPLPYRERRIWNLTTEINLHGIPVDEGAARGAVAYADRALEVFGKELDKITDGAVDAVSQVARLRGWLENELALTPAEMPPNLTRETLDRLLASDELTEAARRALELRRAGGLSSVKKFHAVADRAVQGPEGPTLHDTLMYHGAGTGRWSGIGLQPQNLKRPDLEPGEVDRLLRQLASDGALRGRSFLDGMVLLSDCVRGIVKAHPGRVLVASDYSQIELRVLLWLAEDEKNLQELRDGLDPYKTMAVSIYDTEYARVSKGERQVAKSAVLGCGYGLGAKTFTNTYAKGMGIDLTEQQGEFIVAAYRQKYNEVVQFWYALGDAVQGAIRKPGTEQVCRRIIARTVQNGRWLELVLPSGRPLRYYRPHIEPQVEKPWGFTDETRYYSVDSYTRRWGLTSTYGGKLVENVTQALARDIMAAGLLNCAKAGLNPIMTVHDEVVCHPRLERVEEAPLLLDKVNDCLLNVPQWARGIPLAVEGWYGERYRK